jgi:hypothetical protein
MIDWKSVAFRLHEIAEYYFDCSMDSSLHDEEIEVLHTEYLDLVSTLIADETIDLFVSNE